MYMKEKSEMENLKETINLMKSGDYKNRFIAEYWQVKIRYDKLKAMCEKWDRGELDFKPTCPRAIYNEQLFGMKVYLDTLVKRAKLEDVDLENKANFNYKDISLAVLDSWIEKEYTYENWENFKDDLRTTIEKKYNISVDFRKADFNGILDYCKGVWYERQKNRE